MNPPPCPPSPHRPRIALFFRYGAEEHLTFLPPLPELVLRLSERFEVHHFGMRSPLPRPAALPRELIVHHLPFFRVRRQSSFDKFFKAAIWLACLPALGLYCRLAGFRAVFVDESVPLTPLLLRLFFGRRTAFTVHDFFTEIYFEPRPLLRPVGRLLRAIDNLAWRHTGLLITRVARTRGHLIAQGVDPARIATVGDGGDFTLFRPGDRAAARERFGFAPDDLVLVHHGVMHPNKGNDRVVRAVAALKDRLPRLRFLCIGSGPAFESVRLLATALGVADRVVMTGWMERIEEVAAALNAGDIGLALRIGGPADHFHLTSTLVHNMACGLPVLAARLDGFREILREGENALLFNPDDAGEFQDRILRLAEDPGLRARLAEASLRTAREHFDPREIGDRLADAIGRLAEG